MSALSEAKPLGSRSLSISSDIWADQSAGPSMRAIEAPVPACGRGFAVVADEVRKLAGQTDQAGAQDQ